MLINEFPLYDRRAFPSPDEMTCAEIRMILVNPRASRKLSPYHSLLIRF